MEFASGRRIDRKSEIQQLGIDPHKVGQNLVEIFTRMIFRHRFIHCDAHPGNLLVRKADNDLGHQIVLLDHGLYRSISQETITNFSGLWVSLFVQEKKKVMEYAEKLNIHEHF